MRRPPHITALVRAAEQEIRLTPEQRASELVACEIKAALEPFKGVPVSNIAAQQMADAVQFAMQRLATNDDIPLDLHREFEAEVWPYRIRTSLIHGTHWVRLTPMYR